MALCRSTYYRALPAAARARGVHTLVDRLTCEETLNQSYAWLCGRRKDWPDHADVWDFRARWPQHRAQIQRDIRAGQYRFSLLTCVRTASGEVAHIWAARDALVLKALTIALADVLPVSKRCAHIKGHGGLKGAVRKTALHSASHRFVFKTDVKSYYDSIDHGLLVDRLKRHIRDERILGLIRQYLNRTSEGGGIFYEFEKGISRGCPLSPPIGAFFLYDLDERMEAQATREGLFYVRYMDDILVLAPTRWKLRRAVCTVNEELAALNLRQHPDKTFIGWISRGFDFLGYRFGSDGIAGLARQTLVNFEIKLSRLYEQLHRVSAKRRAVLEERIRTYQRRFTSWAVGGLPHAHDTTFTSLRFRVCYTS